MNIKKLFDLLHRNVNEEALSFYEELELSYNDVKSYCETKEEILTEHLMHLNKKWKKEGIEEFVSEIINLSKDESNLKTYLFKIFPKDISKISFSLNYFFPEKYVFYNSNSEIESEIFRGLEFLSDEIPELYFEFNKIGSEKGFKERYEIFNDNMVAFRDNYFDGTIEERNYKYLYFVYQSLGEVFTDKDNYKRQWFFASKNEYNFLKVDEDGEGTWPARKEMKKGELAFFYRMGGKNIGLSKVTNLLRLEKDPYINPFDYYFCYRVEYKKIGNIEVSLENMQNIWSRLGTVMGITVINMPDYVFYKALKYIDEKIISNINIEIIDFQQEYILDEKFENEDDFEKKQIEKFIKELKFTFTPKPHKKIKIGSDNTKKEVIPDYIVNYYNNPITLFENKYKIKNDGDLEKAYLQGNTYALLFALKVFIVAAIDGVWIYRTKTDHILTNEYKNHIKNYKWNEINDNKQIVDEIHNILLRESK